MNLPVTTIGVHDLSEEAYHADPAPVPSLSASLAKLLIERSPRHAWHSHPRLNPDHEPKNSDAFDLGKIGHRLVLGAGGDFTVIDADDWRTGAAKGLRDLARSGGQTPILAKHFERAEAMARRVHAQLARHQEAAGAFQGGKPEQSLLWTEEVDGQTVWCRARLDYLPAGGNVFDDFKTTAASAAASQWGQRTMWETGCDVQAAFYIRGIKALGLAADPHFRFVVAELEDPFAIAVHTLTPAALAMANRKVEYALRLWARSLAKDWWPGYPPFTAYLDPPPWTEKRWTAREEAGETEPARFDELYPVEPTPLRLPVADDAPATDVFGYVLDAQGQAA